MVECRQLKKNQRELWALTSLIAKEFSALPPAFARAYDARYPAERTRAGKPRKRKAGGGRKGRMQEPEQKLLFILVHQKTSPLQVLVGEVFELSQPSAGKPHDKKIVDTEPIAYPPGTRLYQDTGFQGYTPAGVQSRPPKKSLARANSQRQRSALTSQSPAYESESTMPWGGKTRSERQRGLAQHESRRGGSGHAHCLWVA